MHVSELCVYHLASKEADAEAGIQAVQCRRKMPQKEHERTILGFFPEKMWQNSDLGRLYLSNLPRHKQGTNISKTSAKNGNFKSREDHSPS